MPSQQPVNADAPNIPITMALGVMAGDRRWLISMEDIGEVLQAPALTPVPLTCSWFLGIANVRNHLYSITDLSGCLGSGLTPQDARTRILLIAPHLVPNTGILVRRILGIRNIAAFEPVTDDSNCFSGEITGLLRDREKRIWHRLHLHHLIKHDRFIHVTTEQ